ncbi:MAG: hypothetical protein HKN25_09765 [Pyrinomonadaceae bacterium]|nr:hypothetical protein [Pyrinomonadaceae bacterium]
MSAILGIYERRGAANIEKQLSSSLKVISDYGPDGNDLWISENVGLAHQNLRFAPEDALEELPYFDTESGLVVTADIRLDNRIELFSKLGVTLQKRNQIPNSCLLALAWQKWGKDCPQHLIGDYSFAIWDIRGQTLFCANDHLATRPLYYSITRERFVFASTIECVLSLPGVSDELDEDYVIAALADRDSYKKDRTYFKGIRRLNPGHTLTVSPTTERLDRYWIPEDSKDVRYASDEEYAEAARDIYTRAVNDRLRTTLPVGVHLSGGLDSSSVAVLAARERRRKGLAPPVAYSWSPPPDLTADISDEHQRIGAICRQEGLTAQYCPTNAEDIISVFRKDPTRRPIHVTELAEITVRKKAHADGVRLILSGWGGDDTLSFEGSGYYSYLLLRGRLIRLFRERRRHGSPLKFMLREALLLMFRDRYDGQGKVRARSLRPSGPETFLLPELLAKRTMRKIPCRQSSPRSTMLWRWRSHWITNRIESWAAHGAEKNILYAYPLLDRRLMEFCAGLPAEQFFREGSPRLIMRNAMKGILPDEVRLQKSKGEPVRVKQGLGEAYRAFEKIGRQLANQTEMPSRARYFDMDGLLEQLKPERLAERPNRAGIIGALQFLDF